MLAKEGKIDKKKMQNGKGKKRTNHRNENESGDKGARSNANLPLNNVNQTQFSIVNMNMGALKSLLLMLLLFDVHTILFINKQLCEHEHRAHSTHSTHSTHMHMRWDFKLSQQFRWLFAFKLYFMISMHFSRLMHFIHVIILQRRFKWW